MQLGISCSKITSSIWQVARTYKLYLIVCNQWTSKLVKTGQKSGITTKNGGQILKEQAKDVNNLDIGVQKENAAEQS